MDSPHIALVSEVPDHPVWDLMAVGAAVQRQLNDHVQPAWGKTGSIDVFTSLERVPPDYWPVVVRATFDIPPLGIHLDARGTPYALVKHSISYSLTVSHEVVEMVVDPEGTQTWSAPSLLNPGKDADYLLEVCDPSESAEYAYEIDGILVSDFYLRAYLDREPTSGTRYSFGGHLTRPREVLKDGYLTWREECGTWYQLREFGEHAGEPFKLGRLPDNGKSLRAKVDHRTPHDELDRGLPHDHRQLVAAINSRTKLLANAERRARELRETIAELERDGQTP
jgi:hypothetical protein